MSSKEEKNNINILDVIDTISDIIYVFDMKGNFLIWNKAFERVSEYSKKEVSKMKPTAFFDTKNAIMVGKAIARAFKDGQASVEAEFLTKKKKKIPMIFSGTILKDKKGRTLLCGTGKEIKEQKIREVNLKDNLVRTQKVIDKILPVLQKVALGDFSKNIKIPKKEDEFTELLVSLNLMIDDLREYQLEMDTKVKEQTEKLTESERAFTGAFEAAGIGMALVSPEGGWLKVNPSLCNIIGYSEKELLKKTFQDITHPDDLKADLDLVKQVLKGKIKTYQIEKRYFHKKGNIVWVLLTVSLVRDNNKKPLYFVSQIQDITKEKKINKNFEEKMEELERLNKFMVGRELKMIELKEEINKLKSRTSKGRI